MGFIQTVATLVSSNSNPRWFRSTERVSFETPCLHWASPKLVISALIFREGPKPKIFPALDLTTLVGGDFIESG